MAQELHLTLLGGARITQDESPLTGFVSAKVQALLCYLTVTGRPHTRAELAGLLWGDMADSVAAGNLRKALSNLNQIVGTHLTITRQTVAFNHASPHWLDVEVFQARLQSESEPELLREAVALYHGDFLQGFYVRAAPAFEEWMLLERERLKDMALRALQTLTRYYAARRDYASGLECASRLLALDPWREEAHQQMMRLLAQTGQRSAALAQYETCRRLLREELGVEPMAETVALYESIREATLTPPDNLPSPPTPMVGRENELVEIARLLNQPDCRLLALVGMSGIGKTHLALVAAKAQSKNFLNGAFFVPLAPIRSADFLVPTMAESIGLTLYSGDSPQSQLLHYLSEKRLLLVLDSFERVLAGVNVVAEILAHAPGVKILATSTERLNLHGEWIFPVGGLSVPTNSPDEAIENFSAIQLFLQRAQSLSRRVPLSKAEKHCVVHICQLVEGMPLAIELASAWMRASPCHEIAAEIERNRDFLATTLRDVPERHRSMRAVFDHAWSLLSQAEREAFSKLVVFRNGFERLAAEQIAGASLPLLSALMDKSLLTRSEAGRYQTHDLLRQYAKEKLEQSSFEFQIRDRHLDFFLHLAEEADPQMHGPNQIEWLDRLEAEHDNLRAALEWALRGAHAAVPGALEVALNLASSLGLFWDLRGHFSEGRQWLEQALELEMPPSASIQWKAMRAKALYWAGNLAKWQGDYYRAAELAEANLALCRELDDHWRLAYALYLLGSVTAKQGDLERAKGLLDESERLFREVKARWGLAHTLGTLGNIARAQGRYDEANAQWEESYALYRELGDRRGLARTLNRLWHWPYRQGDYAQAAALLEEAAALFRELKHRDGVAIILRHLGLVAQAEGDFARARTLYEESQNLFQELGDKDDLVYTTWYLGRLMFYERNLDAAKPLLEFSLQLAREVGNKNLIAWVLQTQASVARYQANYEIAYALLSESLTLARQVDEKEAVADALNGFAVLVAAQMQFEKAAQLFGAAEALFQSLNIAPAPVVRAEYEHQVAAVRAQMDEAGFVTAWAVGRKMTLEQAIQLAWGSANLLPA